LKGYILRNNASILFFTLVTMDLGDSTSDSQLMGAAEVAEISEWYNYSNKSCAVNA